MPDDKSMYKIRYSPETYALNQNNPFEMPPLLTERLSAFGFEFNVHHPKRNYVAGRITPQNATEAQKLEGIISVTMDTQYEPDKK